MRKLILLKNTGVKDYVKPTSTNQGPMRKFKDENGLTAIGRGPTMVDIGRSESQVNRYVDHLIKIVKFAQDHKCGVSWS